MKAPLAAKDAGIGPTPPPVLDLLLLQVRPSAAGPRRSLLLPTATCPSSSSSELMAPSSCSLLLPRLVLLAPLLLACVLLLVPLSTDLLRLLLRLFRSVALSFDCPVNASGACQVSLLAEFCRLGLLVIIGRQASCSCLSGSLSSSGSGSCFLPLPLGPDY